MLEQADLPIENHPSHHKLKWLVIFTFGLFTLLIIGVSLFWLTWRQKRDTNITDVPSSSTLPVVSPSPQAIVSTPAPDRRPLGSLAYSFITGVDLDGNRWFERGIPQRANTLRQFDSADSCASIYVTDHGPLETDLSSFAAARYQLGQLPIPSGALYHTQYKIDSFQSLSIGPMGQGEVSNTLVNVNGRVIEIATTLNILDGIVTPNSNCTFPEVSARKVIESIQFAAAIPELSVPNSTQGVKDELSFTYPTGQARAYLQALGEIDVYGIFENVTGRDQCVQHFLAEDTFFVSRQSLELYRPCLEKMYQVSLSKSSKNDYLARIWAEEEYQDNQGRSWTVYDAEVEGFFRVGGYLPIDDQHGYVVELQSWLPNLNGQTEAFTNLAKQTFDSIVLTPTQ